jgi:hypothetical protein
LVAVNIRKKMNVLKALIFSSDKDVKVEIKGIFYDLLNVKI